MSKPRLSKYARQIAPDLERCGYGFARQTGGHFIFTREGFPVFVVPSTPSDPRAYANDMARLKGLHPEMFERRKSENRPSKDARRARSQRREARRPVALTLVAPDRNGDAVATAEPEIPNPGTPEAKALGCFCPAYEVSRHYDLGEGQHVYVKGCPVHVAEWAEEPQPEPVREPTGFDKYERRGRGRPPGSGRSPGCAQCGDPSAGRVTLLLERHPKHSRVASHALTFCEPCAVDVFDAVLAAFGETCKSSKERAA